VDVIFSKIVKINDGPIHNNMPNQFGENWSNLMDVKDVFITTIFFHCEAQDVYGMIIEINGVVASRTHHELFLFCFNHSLADN
jgi:hypothetical protein